MMSDRVTDEYEVIKENFLDCFYTCCCRLFNPKRLNTQDYTPQDVFSEQRGYAYDQTDYDFSPPIEKLMLHVIDMILCSCCGCEKTEKYHYDGIKAILSEHKLSDLIAELEEDERNSLLFDMQLLGIKDHTVSMPDKLPVKNKERKTTSSRATYEEIKAGFLDCYYSYSQHLLLQKKLHNICYSPEEIFFSQHRYACEQNKFAFSLPIENLMLGIVSIILLGGCGSEEDESYYYRQVKTILEQHKLSDLTADLEEEERRMLINDLKRLSLIDDKGNLC